MADLKLTLACWDYDRTRPLIDGRVEPEGIALDVQVLRPREIFHRMQEKQEFQVSEFSASSLAVLTAQGQCPFVGIPVALSKIFRHSCIYVRKGAGIECPEDLRGKRVGTDRYPSSALVFMRGMLQDDYGVRDGDMHWFVGGLNVPVEPPRTPLALPERIELDYLSRNQTLEGMFEAGELDALFCVYLPSLFLEGSPKISRLFPNFKQVERDYYQRTRIFPIMHTVALREDVHREHPWAAKSLYDAFCEAKELAVGDLYDSDALRVALPWLLDYVEDYWRAFGKDFYAYGVDPNRPALAALGRYIFEQGLAPRSVAPDELFAPGVE